MDAFENRLGFGGRVTKLGSCAIQPEIDDRAANRWFYKLIVKCGKLLSLLINYKLMLRSIFFRISRYEQK